MGDSFTNFLLVTLIALLGTIAKIFYSKLESFEKRMEQIFLADMRNMKDIEHLQEAKEDHEERITTLEKNDHKKHY